MANGRINPQQSNVLGQVNQDTSLGPEFTFHHGHVEKVVLQSSDLASFGYPVYGAPSDVSQCILLKPTYGGHSDFNLPSNDLKGMVLAQPLLRGFADSITRGDSVIYMNLGSKFYYLGPINTLNNPNYSPDILYRKDLNPNRVVLDDRKDHEDGYNVNFIRRAINRVTKIKNIILDRPYDTGIGEVGSDAEVESNVSDLTLEGRHGNSIQLGYRFVNPYSIIKNNSSIGNNGSVLGMLSLGSIPDNINGYNTLSSDKRIGEGYENTQEGQYPGYLINFGNDGELGEEAREDIFNIDFGSVENEAEQQTDFDQIIMFSDRITFDAQNNDFTVSAFRNINFGAGKNLTITNKGFSVIESENIYIGKEAKNKAQPMVLGDELRILLLDIMNILQNSRALVQGVPIPLVKQDSSPMAVDIQLIIDSLQPRELSGDPELPQPGNTKFLSQYHYVEQNVRPKPTQE